MANDGRKNVRKLERNYGDRPWKQPGTRVAWYALHPIILLLQWRGRVQGRRQRGDQWCPAPHLKSVPPHFAFGPPVVTYIQYCILKRGPPFWFLTPPSGFWPPLLLNPGDGHGRVQKVKTRFVVSTIAAGLPAGSSVCRSYLLCSDFTHNFPQRARRARCIVEVGCAMLAWLTSVFFFAISIEKCWKVFLHKLYDAVPNEKDVAVYSGLELEADIRSSRTISLKTAKRSLNCPRWRWWAQHLLLWWVGLCTSSDMLRKESVAAGVEDLKRNRQPLQSSQSIRYYHVCANLFYQGSLLFRCLTTFCTHLSVTSFSVANFPEMGRTNLIICVFSRWKSAIRRLLPVFRGVKRQA